MKNRIFNPTQLLSLLVCLLISNLMPTWSFAQSEQQYELIEWVELMPKSDLEILLDPPEFLNNIEDGSESDNVDTLAEQSASNEKAARFNAALQSVNVIEEFDGRAIKIPGFVVPLDVNENRDVVSFFIVPYFGACLHLPPPPPNQILFGEWEEGLTVESLEAPMWFEGTIKIETKANETGKSAYSLKIATVEPYTG